MSNLFSIIARERSEQVCLTTPHIELNDSMDYTYYYDYLKTDH